MSTELRVILITGASSGIGYESALAFARLGYKVGATARHADRLEQLAVAAKDLPGEILTLTADVTDAVQMQQAVEATFARWGRLDILIANAGLAQRGAIVESAWADLDIVLRTNIDGVLHSIRAAVPAMRKSGSGHIILISSIVGVATTPYATIYAASKAALNAIARGLRVELAVDHIWVTNVLVGQTHTELAQVRRGQPGRVASKLPTMTAEYVAQRLVQTVNRQRRTLTLRWLDRLTCFIGAYFPGVMDRIMTRIYQSR